MNIPPFAAYRCGKGGVFMATYPILRGEETVGQAVVEKQGLYWHFACRCSLSGEVIYRLTVQCGQKQENLGIPVPENGEFVLRTKIPVSRLGQERPVIRTVPKHGELQGRFIPLSPDTPFTYISRLEKAVLAKKNGQLGILLPE